MMELGVFSLRFVKSCLFFLPLFFCFQPHTLGWFDSDRLCFAAFSILLQRISTWISVRTFGKTEEEDAEVS